MRVLVTRPVAEAAAFAERLAAAGLTAVIAPLTAIVPRADAPVDLAGVAGLIFTSGNGVRALAALSPRRDLPAWCVGRATATAARAAGFARVADAAGDVAALAALLRARTAPSDGALFYPHGEDRAGDLAAMLAASGYRVRAAVLYEAVAVAALPEPARAALAGHGLDAATFFSPRSARIFEALVRAAGLAESCRTVDAYGLSPAVIAAAAGLPWRRVVAAPAPNATALLEAIRAQMHS